MLPYQKIIQSKIIQKSSGFLGEGQEYYDNATARSVIWLITFEVTDVLPEEGLIILSAIEGSDVQEDSYGRPTRLVPKRQNLHFRDAEGHPTSIWEELAFLDGPMASWSTICFIHPVQAKSGYGEPLDIWL